LVIIVPVFCIKAWFLASADFIYNSANPRVFTRGLTRIGINVPNFSSTAWLATNANVSNCSADPEVWTGSLTF